MASEAAHVLLSVGELRVDFPAHRDHHAGCDLLRIVIAGKVALDVADLAILGAKSPVEILHDGPKLRTRLRQQLHVLRGGRESIGAFFLLFLLSEEGE